MNSATKKENKMKNERLQMVVEDILNNAKTSFWAEICGNEEEIRVENFFDGTLAITVVDDVDELVYNITVNDDAKEEDLEAFLLTIID